MLKHFSFLLILLSGFCFLSPAVDAQDTVDPWTEGVYMSISPPPGTTTINTATVVAHKFRVGSRESPSTIASIVEISMYCETSIAGQIVPTLDIEPQTVAILGDSDHLEVSRDLGWGGLDTIVQVYDRIAGTYVPIEIHISLFATFDSYFDDGVFKRVALFPRAALSAPTCTLHNVGLPSANVAYVFSTLPPVAVELPPVDTPLPPPTVEITPTMTVVPPTEAPPIELPTEVQAPDMPVAPVDPVVTAEAAL